MNACQKKSKLFIISIVFCSCGSLITFCFLFVWESSLSFSLLRKFLTVKIGCSEMLFREWSDIFLERLLSLLFPYTQNGFFVNFMTTYIYIYIHIFYAIRYNFHRFLIPKWIEYTMSNSSSFILFSHVIQYACLLKNDSLQKLKK